MFVVHSMGGLVFKKVSAGSANVHSKFETIRMLTGKGISPRS